ncbi:hypothetical protein E3N88_40742 [Mikania micrantha]|uniref:PARP catalytic domain-containing protein n=1 Tax=Mikania micrantha TaxID=192012 RepID=A0A5N6LNL8_9ASTR|nr:hypothetical protein E3N88_40742 [Mikania micrantha]
MEVPVGEHLRLDKYDSTMVDSQRCWQLSRWKYRWVNILDLINMTPQWWIARGAGNCLDGSTGGWKYRWVNILDLINMTPQWWIARGAGNCLDGSTVPVGEHLRLDKYDSTMVDSQRCWQLSRWKYRWVNILDLINMTPQWWIARGPGNCLRWKYRWVKDRYALGHQIGHVVKQNQTLCKEELGSWISTAYHSQIDGQVKGLFKYWSIGMPPYEMLYGRKCCTPVLRRTRELKPRIIGPFKIIARINDVAYRLELPKEVNGIHDTFHVSSLRKCMADESAYEPLEDLEIDDKLKYVEKPMEVPVGEHLRLDKYDSTMVDSQRCWQLSRWKYRWVNILDLINMTPQWWIARGAGNCLDGSTVPVGEHLRLDKYDSTMVDSQRCWQLSRWKYRWVNILDLINMTPQWWIARGAGNCLDGSTGGWKYRWVNILDLINMTPQWWIARGPGNCLRWKYRWVKDRYALGHQIGHVVKQNQTLCKPTPGGTPQLGKPHDLASANMRQPGFEPNTSHRKVKWVTIRLEALEFEDQASIILEHEEIARPESDLEAPVSSISQLGIFNSDELNVQRVEEGSNEYEILKKSFVGGRRDLGTKIKIVGIHRKKYDWDVMDEARLAVFRVFAAAIASRNGGDPNIRYGWYGGSRDEIMEIMRFGFRRFENRGWSYGRGVHLSPANIPMERNTVLEDTNITAYEHQRFDEQPNELFEFF